MRKIAILTDSACDIPPELEKQYDIDILPFVITLDGVSYVERRDFGFDEFYQMLRAAQGVPSTAQVTAIQFCEQYCKYVDEHSNATNIAANISTSPISKPVVFLPSRSAFGDFLISIKKLL